MFLMVFIYGFTRFFVGATRPLLIPPTPTLLKVVAGAILTLTLAAAVTTIATAAAHRSFSRALQSSAIDH